MTFENKEEFEICNKFINAGLGNIALSARGSISIIVSTENILVSHRILTVKTHNNRKIQIKVRSGVAELLDVLKEKEVNDLKNIDFSKY